jgi:hypothetical protein
MLFIELCPPPEADMPFKLSRPMSSTHQEINPEVVQGSHDHQGEKAIHTLGLSDIGALVDLMTQVTKAERHYGRNPEVPKDLC